MKPVGYFPVAPAFRKNLEQRNKLSRKLIRGELELRVTEFAAGEGHPKDNPSLNQLFEFMLRNAEYKLRFPLIEKEQWLSGAHKISHRPLLRKEASV